MKELTSKTLKFLKIHSQGEDFSKGAAYLSGKFSLHSRSEEPDLYGMLDAVYILYTLNVLHQYTDRDSRSVWAQNILDCQVQDGWFSLKNLRGHSGEHATAYAIGALRLLEIDPDEDYLSQLRPIPALLPIFTERATFISWIKRLDFHLSPKSILQKKLGWHYIWRGSHVGGGIAAIFALTQHLFEKWWPGKVNSNEWFQWYFEWLDTHASPMTGYWQRAFWNLVYRKPTLIDMGGAVHFFWIYEAFGRPFPYPEAVVKSTLTLQSPTGLYKNHPFCIDLDGNFCLTRAYLQLPPEKQNKYRQDVYRSAEKNFEAIVNALTSKPLEEIYNDSHGLPGALAALVECAKLPDFKYAQDIKEWNHPLDKVCWL